MSNGPFEFEFKDDFGDICFLKVLDMYKHHFSGENMRSDQINELKWDLNKATGAFEDLSSYIKETPEECKLGPWCRGCQYAKSYIRYIASCNGSIESFYCGKNEACPSFVQEVYDK